MEKLNIDCLKLIFNELYEDKKSLYSCILVNREWCQLVVPILWESYSCNSADISESREKLSNVIISHLPSSSKQLLVDNNIILPQTTLNKLTFNYISFCKSLKTKFVDKMLYMIFKSKYRKNKYLEIMNFLEEEIYKLYISQCKNIKKLAWENDVSLPLTSYPGAQTLFSQLYRLSINLDFIDSEELFEIAIICKGLNELNINNIHQDIPELIFLIDAQRNLKSLSFCSYLDGETCEELSKALIRKGSTLNNLSLNGSACVISLPSLINLKGLKSIKFNYCEFYDNVKKLRQYLPLFEYSELQFLEYSGIPCFKELALLIEKTKGNIMHVSLCIVNESVIKNTGMVIKAIANNCPKIESLDAYFKQNDLIHIESLLINCSNLNTLRFVSIDKNDNLGNELLNILIKISPKSLTNITISGNIKYSIDTLENFFESYRGRKSLCFNIYDKKYLEIIKKYANEGIVKDSDLLNP
ncbi:hypothetical protein RclHR1_03450007 [Rhizophagus clarus]|uniref:F-box domain-containing protein n=1 Tax=Rhizophagus clarus TaxID=94130 RepID=A0A2Z6RE03_9GLOM|nr:hypothetical protein RclHR1_03450007 [Rhizophagus clarus]GES74346.1 hypothetical protein GLOIN_2v1880763 [Rhizophagus clarus]